MVNPSHPQLDGPKAIGQPATLSLDHLLPSNANRPAKDGDLSGLAASIAQVGLLYPLIVRPHPDQEGDFLIVAGERRYRALKKLKAESAPCVIVNGENGEAPNPEILRVVENHQRKNLSPLEEAVAIRALLGVGLDLQTVARSLGRNRAWIARRSSLADLAECWVRQVKDPDSRIALWPPAYLELIARFPAETQEKILDRWQYAWSRDVPSLADIKDATGHFLQLLSDAPWPLEDDTICPEAGSCNICPKRSGHAPELFPDELPRGCKAAADDHCLDGTCWQRKARSYLTKRIELTRQHHPNLVLLCGGDREVKTALKSEFGLEVFNTWEVAACGSKRHPQALPAIIADGAALGRFKWALPVTENEGDGPAHRPTATSYVATAAARTAEEKKAPYDKRRRQFVIDAVKSRLEALAGEADPFKIRDLEGGAILANRGLLARTLCFLTVMLDDYGWRDSIHKGAFSLPETPAWTDLSTLKNHDLGQGELRETLLDLALKLLRLAVGRYASRLLVSPGERDNARHYTEAETICELLDLDLTGLRAQAAHAIPYAKCWRTEVEDEWRGSAPPLPENANQLEDSSGIHHPAED